jgi:mannosyl-oligosaccharide alpha-1,2-mannosidase
MKVFSQANLTTTGGMLPIRWDLPLGSPSDSMFVFLLNSINRDSRRTLAHLSVGAQADSAHEYLLKLFLLTAKTDKKSLEMCRQFLGLWLSVD